MRENPFSYIREKRPSSDVLIAAASLTAAERDKLASQLSEQDIPIIGQYVFANCQRVGIQRALMYGGLLELFAAAAREDENPDLLENMYTGLGVSRSLAFEFRRVWRVFGRKLTEEPELAEQFVAESLKILVREMTPEGARHEALLLAANGTFIDIATAKNLRNKYLHAVQEPTEVTTTSSNIANTSKPSGIQRLVEAAWQFSGRFVRVVATTVDFGSEDSVNERIADLRRAIADLKRQRQEFQRSQSQAKEVSNV